MSSEFEPASMRCLWIGRYIPYPADGGAKVYSAKLAEALAETGVTVRFLGPGSVDAVPADARSVDWVSVADGKGSELAALFSRLPNAAAIDATRMYRAVLEDQLNESWDAIVLDGYAAGWALDRCLAYVHSRRSRPVLVHVSHNHEEAVWLSLARNPQVSLPKRLALRQNAIKVRVLERRVVRNVDLVSAITDEDGRALLSTIRDHHKPRALTLTPGYAGPKAPPRTINAKTPRRVAIVGSFGWVVKQENLRQFVTLADPIFASHGIALDVIGEVPDRLRDTLRLQSRATQFHGFVDDAVAALAHTRMAVVPEVFGGGFKLKFLDYIFARTPVATLDYAAAGLPPELRAAMIHRDNLPALVDAIVTEIDQCELLNRYQQSAFELAQNMFRWSDRGQQLRQAIAQIHRQHQTHAPREGSVDELKRLRASPVK